jgi:hypothetical protein
MKGPECKQFGNCAFPEGHSLVKIRASLLCSLGTRGEYFATMWDKVALYAMITGEDSRSSKQVRIMTASFSRPAIISRQVMRRAHLSGGALMARATESNI